MKNQVPLDFGVSVGHVAVRYGYEEAGFLHQIMYWYRENKVYNRNFYDGRWWTWNSIAAYGQKFPWWSEKQLRRIIESCKRQGAILTANYNEDQRDRTLWYTPSDELLAMYGDDPAPVSICPNGKMQSQERADTVAQMGEPLPKENQKKTDTPCNPPEKTTPTKASKYDLAEDAIPILHDYVNGDRELAHALNDMIESRKELKAINSKRAIKALLGELDRLSEGDRNIKLILLRRAVAAQWKSVYPLRRDEVPSRVDGNGGLRPDSEVLRAEDSPWYRFGGDSTT